MTSSTTAQERGGKANPKRGNNFREIAIQFVTAFPVGTELAVEVFDQWAINNGYLPKPKSQARQSDAWKAHLHRRHELRYKIIKAGAHPVMFEKGAVPFSMDKISNGVYRVRNPQDAIMQQHLPTRVLSLTKTKRKQLDYLMQSADWLTMEPYERAMAEMIYDAIDTFEERIDLEARGIDRALVRLEKRLREHGITQLAITPPEDEAPDEE